MFGSIKDRVALSNGVEMPWLGLGVWQVENEAELAGAVRAAVGAGYESVDTATIYGNEPLVGRAVKALPEGRKNLFITSKLWNNMHDKVEEAYENSLKSLQLDILDLYLIHWPAPKRGKYVEAWKSLVKLYEEKRVRAIGVSNFTIEQLERIIDATGVVPHVHQVERHPLLQQKELTEYCVKKGIRMEAYSPLLNGNLRDVAPALEPIAKKYGKTPAQIILRWNLDTGYVVIPKSVTPARIEENGALFDFKLDESDLAFISSLDKKHRYLPDAEHGPQ